MVCRGDSEFVVEAVVPDFGHVVPVRYDTVLDGVLEFKDSLLGLSFGSHICLLFVHAHHHIFVFWPSDNGGE